MRVLVTGGRNFANRDFLFETLDRLHNVRPFSVLIHGGASGADLLAGEWAASRGVSVEAFPADWRKHGQSAGPIRNKAMLEKCPDFVVAFQGGTGTADMVRRAERAGVEVIHANTTSPCQERMF